MLWPRTVLLIALACLAAAPAARAAVPIGAPLNLPATATEGCEATVLPSLRPVIGVPPSCTLYGVDAAGAWTSQVPRGRWVITRARVRAGARVGPMAFTAVRAMRSRAGADAGPAAGVICCTASAESQAFTPQPNAVTTVPVRVPVRNTVEPIDGEPVEHVDYLGITLLSLESSMPVHAAAPGATGSTSTTSWFAPAMRAGQQRLQGGSAPRTVPLVSADLEPDADGDGLGDETQDPDRGAGGAGSAGSVGAPGSAGTAGSPGTAGSAGSAGSAATGAPPSAAKLEVARARVLRSSRRLDVLAPITGRASGKLRVSFRAAGRTTRFDAEVDAGNRRVVIRRSLPRAQARLGTGILTLSYPGDADTQPQEVRLRAAARKADLDAGRPRIAGDRLTARGTISPRARGVVRLQVLFEPAGGATRTLEYSARIRNGRYAIDERLPAELVAAIAGRRGVVHTYTLFTGYQRARMRGEMESFQVLGAR